MGARKRTGPPPGARRLDRIARKISAFVWEAPAVSIAVGPAATDARAVGSEEIRVVCNGIEDQPGFRKQGLACASGQVGGVGAGPGRASARVVFVVWD